tara:strand:+ start:542 stop:721 length:180 start_codon:yes stop_codon:yes gene_type:complete
MMIELVWNDQKFGSRSKGKIDTYEITPDRKRFYLEINGVQMFEGSLIGCKNSAECFENK